MSNVALTRRPRRLALARRTVAELLRSRSPALRRGGRPLPAAPLPPPVAGVDEVLATLLAEARQIDVRARTVAGPWTWFVRALRSRHPIEPAAITPIAGGVRVRFDAGDPAADHLGFGLPLAPGERIVGLGERASGVDQRGWFLESWAEEGAIGLGEKLSPLLTALGVPWNPFPKGPAVTYKPVPWFLSSRGYAVFVDTTAFACFDIGADDPGAIQIDVAATTIDLVVLAAPTPAALLRRLVELTDGTPRGLPDWALAPWLDALGGQARVEELARLTRDAGIPCGAIWAEDWQGLERKPFGDSKWSYDAIFPVKRHACRERFPTIEQLADQLHARGLRLLTYYYPYVSALDDEHARADQRGLFLKDRSGATCRIPLFMDAGAQIDLTNPEARAWYKEELRRGLALGVDGWMADFGEYTPVDAVAHDGEPGLVHHNRYPRLWAALHRELLDEERPGDHVFFSRSGSVGQQRDTPLFWCGDSNTDFERWDGLPGNLRMLLSAGLSGFSVWTVDIGGYTCLFTRGRDAETLARWTELGALLIVMRTHHGTHVRRCVQPDHDDATLGHFATYARLHAALFPLRRALLDHACATGLPVARALLLEHPDDAEAWAIEDQYLLGADLLVAPVVERGMRARDVYHPRGRDWIDLWTGERRRGGERAVVAAPIGRIPLALASDAVLPVFDCRVDTFDRRDRVADPTVVTLDDAERHLALLVGPDFVGETRLYDGTKVTYVPGARGELGTRAERDADNPLLPPALNATWPCLAAACGALVQLPWRDGALRVESPFVRRVRVSACAA